jgi:regulator of replication initiation timing
MTLETAQMTRIEINRSIMEINNRKEVLQRQIDNLNEHIQFLVAQREQLRFNDTPLFDELFGG